MLLLWGKLTPYLQPTQLPTAPCGHLFGSAQKAHVLSGSVCRRCLQSLTGTAKTRQHCQLALLSLPPWRFFPRSSFTPLALPSSLPLVSLPFSWNSRLASSCPLCQYVWHHFCCLFSLSCSFFHSLCSQCASSTDNVVVVSLFTAVIVGLMTDNSQRLSLLFRVMFCYGVMCVGSIRLPSSFIFIALFLPSWLLFALCLLSPLSWNLKQVF